MPDGKRCVCWLRVVAMAVAAVQLAALARSAPMVDPSTTLGCHRRSYRFNMTSGSCWGMVDVEACWGRCDSWEIGVPRYPHFQKFHPVCVYEGRRERTVELTHCGADSESPAEITVTDATACSCRMCNERDTRCEMY